MGILKPLQRLLDVTGAPSDDQLGPDSYHRAADQARLLQHEPDQVVVI